MNLTKATKIAISSAIQSQEKHKMGCIIYERSKYVSAPNRSFPVLVRDRSTPYSLHAEAACINHALHGNINLKKSTLIVVRINNCGNLMLAKPCQKCQNLIKSVGIPKIYFSKDPMDREFTPDNFKSLGL